MSLWQAIKNAFIPWNLVRRSSAPEQDGVQHVDYGQLLIDGTSGDISDMAQVIAHAEKPLESPKPPSISEA